MTPPAENAPSPHPQIQGRIMDVLWGSAVEAFVNAIMVSVLGSVGLSLLGGLLDGMAPSLPPFLESKSTTAAASSSLAHGWWGSLTKHGFAILWAIFFVHTAWVRLVGVRAENEPSGAAARVRQAFALFSENWFELMVGNAFGALFAAIAWVWIQHFSFSQMLWGWLLGPVLGELHTLATHLLGAARVDSIDGLLAWYHQNEFRFTFWVFYVAAICDDLGLPSIKTLGHRAYRWLRGEKHEPPAPITMVS